MLDLELVNWTEPVDIIIHRSQIAEACQLAWAQGYSGELSPRYGEKFGTKIGSEYRFWTSTFKKDKEDAKT